MINFFDILKTEKTTNDSYNPYAAKINGVWIEGSVSVDYLNEHFGHLKNVEEMKNATESEGLKLYFEWLKEKGILK